jgi:HSP20 family protein
MFITNILNDFQKMQNEMAWAFGSQGNYQGDFPAVQIYSDKDHLILRADVPGLSKEDMELSITEDVVTISGEIKKIELAEGSRIVKRERRSGKFQKTVELPYPVDSERSEAVLKNGVLTINFPIKETVKPRQIQIKVN